MPIVRRFKRAICLVKDCFSGHSGHSDPLDTASPRSVSIGGNKESLKQSDNDGIGISAPKSGHDDLASSITDPSTAISKRSQVSWKSDFWLQASEKLQTKDPELFERY